ncbi:hypothetical protein FO519_008045 [Halicephalobus sp. NKZ332]|nr:hypothetical protein FO519_008045 [Halicephalobus sp. NKZ332]
MDDPLDEEPIHQNDHLPFDFDEGTQTMLEKVSEFLILDPSKIPATSFSFRSVDPSEFPSSWVKIKENGKFEFVCLIKNCGLCFENHDLLQVHMDDHIRNGFRDLTEGSGTKVKCPVHKCGKEVSTFQHLFRHIKSHLFHAEKQWTGLHTYKKLFPDLKPCGFEKTPHISDDGDAFVCGWVNCHKEIDDIAEYVRHTYSHLDEIDEYDKDIDGMFHCLWSTDERHCNQKFAHKFNLRVHLRVHSLDKACACPFCGAMFTNNTKLSDHVLRRQSKDEAPHNCNLCQKKFATKRLLMLHCRKHIKSVKCAYCDVVMDCASAITKHMKLVHAKIRGEKCKQCDASFGLKTDLQKHIAAIHQKEPQFTCPQCPSLKFRWQKQLRLHEKSHNTNYIADPYLCHKCTMKYKSGSSLSRHFTSVHNLALPTGFNRFQYKKCHDGYYRLQTARCLSNDVVEASKLKMLRLLSLRSKVSFRYLSSTSVCRVLSQEFYLEKEWENRHSALKELNLGGDYEWIAAVQKKFVGGGKASAVDVDGATCISEESDQLNDIMELVYKLRHTENAADLLPSTEYALFRLFMKHDAADELFKVINDTINYGAFPNYHISALLINYLLKKDNIPGAAKIATTVVQQEMFESPLLNYLSLYAISKFIELSPEKRIFDEKIHTKYVPLDEDEINEEEIRTMKFPYLKNRFFDEHFDLEETEHLVGKSIEWLSREVNDMKDKELKKGLEILALVYKDKFEDLKKVLEIKEEVKINDSACKAAISRLEQNIGKLPEEGREENEDFKKLSGLIAKIEALPKEETLLSEAILKKIKSIQSAGEKELVEDQKKQFLDWNKLRKDLIRMQAERVNLKLRIEEIKKELIQKEEEKEMLFFFENRVNWEDRAEEKDKLFEEFNLNKKDETVTESEYAKTMFDNVKSKNRQNAQS